MRRLACWLVVFISLIWIPHLRAAPAANSNPASPTEDELLDFDNADKAQNPGAAPPASEPTPVPQAAPPEAQAPAPESAPATGSAAETPSLDEPEAPPAQSAQPVTPPVAPPPAAAAQAPAPPPPAPAPATPPAMTSEAPPPPAAPPAEAPPAPPSEAPSEPGAPGQPPAPPATASKKSQPPSNPQDLTIDDLDQNATPQEPAPAPNEPMAPPPPPEVEGAPPQEMPPPAQAQGPAPAPAPGQEAEPPPPEIMNPDGTPAENPPAPETQEPAMAAPEKSQPAEENAPSGEVAGNEDEVSARDAANESRFARIYRKYNSAQISDDQWSEITSDKEQESYTLQPGDTLWDISAKFFGNAFYWPKIWELNDEITNPHLIMPGNELNFSSGSSTEAPSLAVKQKSEATQDLAENDEDEAGEPEPAPEVEDFPTAQSPTGNIIIPPPKRRHPVMEHIPPSFPDTNAKSNKYDEMGFALDEDQPVRAKPAVTAIPTIISDHDWDSDGEVVEMGGDVSVASTFQDIIIKLNKPAQKGEIYTVFAKRGSVSDPVAGGNVGSEIDTKAEIQIEEPVEGSSDTFRAMVTFTAMPVLLGDKLKEGKLVSRASIDDKGVLSQVTATLVNAQYTNRHVIMGNEFVFLNRGSADGLQVGNLLNVVKNYKIRNPKAAIQFDNKAIGLVKVVNVGEHVATAAVVREFDAIYPGDSTSATAEFPATGDPSAPAPNSDSQ